MRASHFVFSVLSWLSHITCVDFTLLEVIIWDLELSKLIQEYDVSVYFLHSGLLLFRIVVIYLVHPFLGCSWSDQLICDLLSKLHIYLTADNTFYFYFFRIHNNNGQTAAQLANACGYSDLANYLLQAEGKQGMI